MTTLKTVRNDNRNLVSASALYAAMKQEQNGLDEREKRNAYRKWIADRIINLEMEEGFDFFIYLDINSIMEMIKYEPATKEVKRFFEEYKYNKQEA